MPMKRNLLLGAALLLPLVATAELNEEAAIKYRQAVMKSASGHLKAASLIVKGEVELKPQLAQHARALSDMGATLASLFPEGSDFGETDAKGAIWEQPEAFAEKVRAFDTAAKAFAAGPDTQTLDALGDACKGCHKEFREK